MKKILGRIMSGNNKQQGIALLFALAILSLLMVMAMGFAVSSIFEQKAANNSANTSSARFLAQSALNRALTLVNMYGDTVQSSHDTSGDKDMLSHLSLDVAGVPLYTFDPAGNVTWEYLKMNDGSSDRLLGRFAYVIIPVAGLDPGTLVRDSVNEAAVTAAEQRLGVYVDEINLRSISPTDIVATSPTSVQVSAQKFNYTTYTAAPGLYPGQDPGWQSFQNLFEKTGVTDEALQSKMLRWFVLDTGRFKSKESYWVDDNSPKYYHRFNLARTDWDTAFDTKEEMYEKILLDKNPIDGVPDQLPLTYSTSSVYEDGYGIPWLAFFGYTANGTLDATQQGTFNSVVDRRRQIAANLVDYCRSDTIPPTKLPMSDVDPATWYNGTTWGTIPTFTGNKKTPYINELGFHIMVECMQTSSGTANNKGKGKGKGKGKTTTTNTIDLNVSVDAFVELVDIYDVALSSIDSTVSIDYSLSYSVTGTAAPGGTSTFSGTINIPVKRSDWDTLTTPSTKKRYASPDWFPFHDNDPILSVTISAGTAVNISVNNISLQIKKAVLNYNGINCDYAKLNASAAPVTISVSIPANTTDTIDKDYYLSLQANDPRQNLNPGDWTKTQSGIGSDFDSANYSLPVASGGTGIGTLEAKNIFSIPATGLDQEVADPVASSTAFIRQGPMQSPWELGLIHRGKAWETINLKEFDPNKSFKYIAATAGPPATPNIIPGGGKYSDTANGGGDANILDQIKMNSTVNNFKVNINNEFQEPPVTTASKYTVLEALFANIKTGCTDKKTPETGTPLSPADISGIGGLIPAIVSKAKDYTNRAQVVNDITGALPISGYTTDAQKEELIGKFVNLTEIGGKYYYLIVLAQAIKDIGAPSGAASGITIKKKDKAGNTITFTNACLGNFEHPVESPAGSGNFVYADEIVAEQKIKVLMYEPPSGNPIIVSYEFVE